MEALGWVVVGAESCIGVPSCEVGKSPAVHFDAGNGGKVSVELDLGDWKTAELAEGQLSGGFLLFLLWWWWFHPLHLVTRTATCSAMIIDALEADAAMMWVIMGLTCWWRAWLVVVKVLVRVVSHFE